MKTLVAEIPFAILIGGGVLLSLYLANRFYDLLGGQNQWLTRKIGHLGGFVGYLLCPYVFSSVVWPLILSGGFTLLLGVSRALGGPHIFRGVARATAAAELWYPVSGTAVLAIMWGIFNKPFEAIAVIGMMAAGDAITGICRSRFVQKPEKHWSGSIAMLFVSLILVWSFIQPFWVGALAAIGATIAEWACGDVGKIRAIDDNLAIPMVGTIIVLGGLYGIGAL